MPNFVKGLFESRPLRVLGWVILLALGPALPSARVRGQARGPGSVIESELSAGIEGHVREGGGAGGVAAATVRAYSAIASGQRLETETDASGYYHLSGLRPGVYEVSVSKNGFGALGSSSSRGVSPARKRVTAIAGTEVKGIDFNLPRGGVISGRIVDEDGVPVVQARVIPLRRGPVAAASSLVESGPAAQTNDQGHFRLFDLSPGRYYLWASVPARPVEFGLVAHRTGKANGPQIGFAPAYYPGVADANQAASVLVQPGQETSGSDLRLHRRPVFVVAGEVQGADGQGAESESGRRGMIVTLVREDVTGGGPDTSQTTATDERGHFTFRNILPGPYRVTVSKRNPSGRSVYGTEEVVVGNEPLQDLKISLVPAPDVRGAIRVEADAALPPGDPIIINCVPIDTALRFMSSVSTTVDSSGQFLLPSVPPGKYHLYIDKLPPTGFVKLLRYGSLDAPKQDFVVLSAPQILDVQISLAGAEINGKVEDDQGNTVSGAHVIMLRGSEWQVDFDCDQNGIFHRTGLPPATYELHAFNPSGGALVGDDDLIGRNAARALRVDLGGGGTTSVTLKATKSD